MDATTTAVWKLLDITIKNMRNSDSRIHLNAMAKSKFKSNFESLIQNIKDEYMDDTVKNLDRHKCSAIIIVSILKSQAITYNGKLDEGVIFIGQYIAATSVGFTYMQSCLNSLLKEKGESKVIDKLCFPTPMSCETPYFDVFCRNLYYADNNNEWGLNPLDIADRLFLLEYYTLIKNDIDPSILNEY